MPLTAGAHLGPYEILAGIGAGGMGEVYRARDTRLDRTVAIKVLAEHRITDPQMRQRFDREARAVAALSHPHICHLNDVGHDDGVDFLVMEYLEGETLAVRLARAPLPLGEVLRYAIEIAEALSEAHRHGIVHRDLKPGNVILTRTGVKLLDFGLAKLQPIATATPSLSTLGPTHEAPLTGEGSILGTWPYMSPEQVEGKEADARTDIFGLGAVLYEMATGRRAFAGDSHASLIAAILERDPEPFADRLPDAPAALERVVRKCLAKHPDARWQSASDLADALRWIAEEYQSTSQRVTEAPAVSARSARWPWIASIVIAAGIIAAGAAMWPTASVPAASIRRFVIQPAADARLAEPQPRFALSLDGRTLVYTANGVINRDGGAGGRGNSLFVRPLDQLVARPIPGTENASELTLSPDGQWVAFIANDTLKKVSLTSGAPPILLADDIGALEQSIEWLPDNTIVVGRFHDVAGGGLYRVAANGGAMERLTIPDASQGELDHHFPRALPGGRVLLLTRHLKAGADSYDVAGLQLDTGAIRTIVPDGFDARYVPTGHLVFARGEALMAAPFDINRLALSGPPIVVVDQVMSANNVGGSGAFGRGARYAVADDGTLAYIPPVTRRGRRLAWVRAAEPPEPLPFAPRAFARPSLSPDGTRVAVQIEEEGGPDIWLYDLRQGTFTPLTSDKTSQAPIWTRDGQRVTFSRLKDGREELYWQPTDGAPAELLLADALRLFPGSWSPAGRTLVFVRNPNNDLTELGQFDLDTRQWKTLPVAATNIRHPQISPDGRWLAYVAQTRRPEVYVAALGGSTVKRQISNDGGYAPVWSRDGKVLYYRNLAGLNGAGDFVTVDVSRLPATIGKPTPLARALPAVRGGQYHVGYDVAADGRLLIVQPDPEESAPLRFEIVLNWFEELKARVPTK
jgi:serine/threonine-protein kinase